MRTFLVFVVLLATGCAGWRETAIAQADNSPPAFAVTLPPEPVPAATLPVIEPAAQVPSVEEAPVVVKPPPRPVAAVEPFLDLDDLKSRLRETEALGLMAKLELRGQVDALLKAFRAHHQGGASSGIVTLRQSFNALMQKVLALIRDGDPALASMLDRSRDGIWSVLEDREKFETVN